MPIPAIPAIVAGAARTVGGSLISSFFASAPAAVAAVRPGLGAALKAKAGGVRDFFYAHAWALDAADSLSSRVLGRIQSNFPAFVHTISVVVQGGPQCDIRRVWYLALAACFGRYRNRVRGIQQADMDATWDVTNKRCSVAVSYATSGAWQAFQAGGGSNLSSPIALIQRGPTQVTIGGSWPAFLTQSNLRTVAGDVVGGLVAVAPGLGALASALLGPLSGGILGTSPNVVAPPSWPSVKEVTDRVTPVTYIALYQTFGTTPSVFQELGRNPLVIPWSRVLPVGTRSGPSASTQGNSSQSPTLPDDGRVITTGQKLHPRLQSPRPPVDGKTRSCLLTLVAQTLSTPGILPASPPSSGAYLGDPGLFVYNPGLGLEPETGSGGRFTELVQEADRFLSTPVFGVPATGLGPDGYPLPQQNKVVNVRQ